MENTKSSLDALVFAPHPDDAEIGMGGTILKMMAAGLRVGVVDLTRGELGTKGSAEIRKQELEAASAILKLSYRGNLDLGDGNIFDNELNRLKVVEEIRKHRSPLVFVTSPFDRHPDHRYAAELIKNAFFLSRLPKYTTASPSYSPKRLFHFLIHDTDSISFAVNITEYFSQKIESLRAYRSQFVEPVLPSDYRYMGLSDYLEQIEAGNRIIGMRIGVKYAEGFFSRYPVAIALPSDLE